ncbi:hypothetical protein F2Q70_00021057 [Brassica cretica]|nr:hypothetical protein F2Q70_00021057 [Brassica cretica]
MKENGRRDLQKQKKKRDAKNDSGSDYDDALECASESDGDGVDGSMDYVELAENYERLESHKAEGVFVSAGKIEVVVSSTTKRVVKMYAGKASHKRLMRKL